MAGAIAKLFGGGEPSPLCTPQVRAAVAALDNAAEALAREQANAATLAASVERLARERDAAQGEARDLVARRVECIRRNEGTHEIDAALAVANERGRIAKSDHAAAVRMAHAHRRHGAAMREPGALAAAETAHREAMDRVVQALNSAAVKCGHPVTTVEHTYGSATIGVAGKIVFADFAAACREGGV